MKYIFHPAFVGALLVFEVVLVGAEIVSPMVGLLILAATSGIYGIIGLIIDSNMGGGEKKND
jgi:hypothetical protein